MVDFSTIELNVIPLPVSQLQEINTDLLKKNKVLIYTVSICGAVIGIYLLRKIIYHIKNEEND